MSILLTLEKILRWAILNNKFSIIFGAFLRYENVTQYDLEEDFFCFGANGMVAFEGNHKSAFVKDMAMIYVVHVHIAMQQENLAILLLFAMTFRIEGLLQAKYSYFTSFLGIS